MMTTFFSSLHDLSQIQWSGRSVFFFVETTRLPFHWSKPRPFEKSFATTWPGSSTTDGRVRLFFISDVHQSLNETLILFVLENIVYCPLFIVIVLFLTKYENFFFRPLNTRSSIFIQDYKSCYEIVIIIYRVSF